MITKRLATLLAAGALVAGALQAHAVPITGSVDMSGTATLNSTSLGAATAATAFSGVLVGGTPTGSFAGTAGSSVTWAPFTFGSATDVTPLWSFVSGAWTYSFNLEDQTIVSQDNFFLNIVGKGDLSITGAGSPYTVTSGAWSFTISNPTGGPHANFEFTFANSQTSVPDGGATAMMLGLGVLGMATLRRKLS